MNENQIEKTPERVLISTSTGEIIDQYYQGDQLSVRRKEQQDYIDSRIIDFNRDKSFVKIYDEVVPLLEKYLTLPEFKFAICLTPHVSFEDCIIRKTMDRRSKILSIKELAEIHGYKYDYAKKLMAALQHKGVIGKHESGNILYEDVPNQTVFTVNPYIYFRGNDINKTIHSFYNSSGWKELLMRQNNS